MTLFEAVQAVVAADDAFDPDKGGPAYELIDAATKACREVLARRPNAAGPLVDAAKAIVAWDDDDTEHADYDVDWNSYDAAVDQCRNALHAMVSPIVTGG